MTYMAIGATKFGSSPLLARTAKRIATATACLLLYKPAPSALLHCSAPPPQAVFVRLCGLAFA